MKTDRDFMLWAIEEARKCKPENPAKIPCVGAVITYDGEVIGSGHRGPDDHAEKVALDSVRDRTKLSEATVYTTLEPCTGDVRRRPAEACTNLLTSLNVKKVFIGILDPNQGVSGKGVLKLQEHDIEVALFDHDLAKQVRDLNKEFILEQQSIGVEILNSNPTPNISTKNTSGKHAFKCTCKNPPGADIHVLVKQAEFWWPQNSPLKKVNDFNEYEFDVHFGIKGSHTIHIVKASDLGSELIRYYLRVGSNFEHWRKLIGETTINLPGSNYVGINMVNLPRGLDSQASILVNVIDTPWDHLHEP